MKTLFGVTALVIFNLQWGVLSGQTYTLSTYTADYVSVGVGFPLTEGVWDNPNFVVPIQYPFYVFDDLVSNLELIPEYSEGGAMVARLDGNIASVFHLFGPDLIDRGYYTGHSASAIFFSYAGPPGQRVFIQEWLNVGFAHGDTVDGFFTDFINFQLQLHEATREIIFHFGSSNITNPLADYEGQTGPSIGLLKEVDITGFGLPEETFFLSGNPQNPTIVTEFMPVYLEGSIPENTVYRFTQASTSLEPDEKKQHNPVFYPNPVNGEIYIRPDYEATITFPVQLIASNGMFIRTFSDPDQLNVYNVPPGIYELRYRTDHGWAGERILVTD